MSEEISESGCTNVFKLAPQFSFAHANTTRQNPRNIFLAEPMIESSAFWFLQIFIPTINKIPKCSAKSTKINLSSA